MKKRQEFSRQMNYTLRKINEMYSELKNIEEEIDILEAIHARPNLLLERLSGLNLCGRKLNNITLFEYAVLKEIEEGQRPLCEILLNNIPDNDSGRKVKFQLLLTCVARGEQYLAGKILSQAPEMLLERGNVTDYSGRTFINVTAFELLLWALDTRHMWEMVSNCIPSGELGEAIRHNLLQQYMAVENIGVTYILNDQQYTESHYDCSPLLSALGNYIEGRDNVVISTETIPFINKLRQYYISAVGGAQRLVPAHVAQHFCEQGSVFEERLYEYDVFLRTGTVYINYGNSYSEPSWFLLINSEPGLGQKLAISRQPCSSPYGKTIGYHATPCNFPIARVVKNAYLSLERLFQVRIGDLQNIKMQLSEELNCMENTKNRLGL